MSQETLEQLLATREERIKEFKYLCESFPGGAIRFRPEADEAQAYVIEKMTANNSVEQMIRVLMEIETSKMVVASVAMLADHKTQICESIGQFKMLDLGIRVLVKMREQAQAQPASVEE